MQHSSLIILPEHVLLAHHLGLAGRLPKNLKREQCINKKVQERQSRKKCAASISVLTRWYWADRLSTAGLLAILGMLSPRWYFGFLALLMLDIFSHWFQMYATMASGASTHKVGHPSQPIQASGSWVCMSPYVRTNQLARHALTKAAAGILARPGTQRWSLPLELESWLCLGRALLCHELSAMMTAKRHRLATSSSIPCGALGAFSCEFLCDLSHSEIWHGDPSQSDRFLCLKLPA